MSRKHHYAQSPLPAVGLVVVFINPWKPEPSWNLALLCSDPGFEAVPGAGSRGHCEPTQGSRAGPGNHSPGFRQSQWPAKVRAGGRCQGLGEPVRSLVPGRFCGPVLSAVIKITAPLTGRSLCVGLHCVPSCAVSL